MTACGYRIHRNKPNVARSRLGALRGFLDDLVGRELIELNVARMLPTRAVPPPPASRARYPSAGEVQRLWLAAGELHPRVPVEGQPSRYCDLIRLLILLPFRRGEMTGLAAGDVDQRRREIRLPPARTKNKREFTMPLADAAVEILAPRVAACASADERLFGQRLDWDSLLIRLRKLSAVEQFSMHDLRRLFASECGEHGIGDFDLIDGLLGAFGLGIPRRRCWRLSACQSRRGAPRHYGEVGEPRGSCDHTWPLAARDRGARRRRSHEHRKATTVTA